MDQTSIALGLEIEDVSIRGIKEGQTPFLILGEASKGKTDIIRVILNQLCGDNIVYLFDNRKLELYDYQSRDGVQYIEKDEFDTFVDELMSSCKIRMQEYKKELVRRWSFVYGWNLRKNKITQEYRKVERIVKYT